MKHFAKIDDAGWVLEVFEVEDADTDGIPGLIQINGWAGYGAAPEKPRVVNGALTYQDPRTLSLAKDQKRGQINAARLAANRSGFTFAGKLISTDELSRSDIDGTNSNVVLNNAFPAGWPGAWKAEDNSFVPIPDLDTWRQFIAAMAAQGAANFATAQALKAQLDAAQTMAEVDAVAWPAPAP